MEDENDYEKARQERIKRNQEFMKSMNLKSPVEVKKSEVQKRARAPAPLVGSSTPSRRSSRARPQVNFKAIESKLDSDDSDRSDDSESEAESKRKKRKRKNDDDDEFEGDEEAQDSDISANDEDFEDLSLLRDAAPRKRGPKKNQSNLPDVSVPLGADPIMTSEIQKSSQCHACKQWTAQDKAKCRNAGCGLLFCRVCLRNNNERYTDAKKDSDWICPACRFVCNCSEHMAQRLKKLASVPLSGPTSASTSLVAHISRPLPIQAPESSEESNESEEDDGMYYAEKILEKRERGGQVEYLCKFEGWDDSANTWISLNGLKETCQDLIDDFESPTKSPIKQAKKSQNKSTAHARPHAVQLFDLSVAHH